MPKSHKPRIFRHLVLIIIMGGTLYSMINGIQHMLHPKRVYRPPLTLQEHLSFIPEDEMTVDETTPEEVTILWKNIAIKIGSHETIEQKALILKHLFPIIQTRYDTIEYVDVRFPENVVIGYMKPKEGKVPTSNE